MYKSNIQQIMKTTLIILLSLVSSLVSAQEPPSRPYTGPTQISTFNGHEAEWGWSGKNKGLYSKDAVISILQENWGKVSPLDLQMKVDKVTFAEFLWKITPDLVDQAVKSGSTFIVGGTKVDSLVITLDTAGKGKITLISEGWVVGYTRCQSAAKREGENSQLDQGEYKVLDKKEVHFSTEIGQGTPGTEDFKGAKMPKALLLDASRGIWVHCGDLSSPSGGCIRVSKPVERELFKLISIGTPVKMFWK
jgi:hypothetical protein